MATNATNLTTITADLPDFASDTIDFKLLSSIAISGTEIFPGEVYTMTLDVNGDGSLDIPTPDGTGDSAWLWEVNLPDAREENVSIAWSALSQDLATILAAAVSDTTPSDVAQLITNKVDRTGDTMSGDLTMSSASLVEADTISLDTGYTETGAEAVATRFWNAVKGTTSLVTADGSILDDGQELRFYGKASGAITNGDFVQFAGAQGDHVLFKKVVPAEVIANRYLFMGVATTDIANGSFGNITVLGYVNDISTTGWTQNDLIYMDNATGQGTNAEPAAGGVKILVASVIKEETSVPAANGSILVRPTWYNRFTELEDVDGTPASVTGDFYTYNSVTDTFEAVNNTNDFEPALGSPASDGYVLSSTIAGTRSWVAQSAGAGDLLSTNNLSDVANAITALSNLGLTATAEQINSLIEGKWKIWSCVLRNTAGTWGLLDDADHTPLNVTNITQDGGGVFINLSITAGRVITSVCQPDEQYSGLYTFGISQGLSQASVTIRRASAGGLPIWLCTNNLATTPYFTVTNFGGGALPISSATWSAGVLTINHAESVPGVPVFNNMGFDVQNMMAANAYSYTVTPIKFFNMAGTQLLDPTTGGGRDFPASYRFAVQRGAGILPVSIVNPSAAELQIANSNVWCFGLVEME